MFTLEDLINNYNEEELMKLQEQIEDQIEKTKRVWQDISLPLIAPIGTLLVQQKTINEALEIVKNRNFKR